MEETIENGTETIESTTEQQEEVRSYSFEEVQALLQKESDRRVTQALAKQKKDFDKKMSLSKLDENERAKAEKDARIAELEEQLQLYAVEKAKAEIVSVLSKRGLDATLANYLSITDDASENQATIDAFDKIFKKAVREEVERRISSPTPKSNATSSTGEITKEQFRQMKLSEQAMLNHENPELYKRLTTN